MKSALPLRGIQVVTIATNVPGPAAAARLHQLGATVMKVEPPGGDPLQGHCPAWYRELNAGQKIVRLNLKDARGRKRFNRLLDRADLLLTSSRPAAMTRLWLGWTGLHAQFPRLCQVALLGYPRPNENISGHDLTYLAQVGLLTPPQMPVTLLGDLASAEKMVSEALAALLRRERRGEGTHREVAISDAAEAFAAPLRHGLTSARGLLGGLLPHYNLYRASDGWIAVGALEPHFQESLRTGLRLKKLGHQQLTAAFRKRSAKAWERWGREHDLPIAAVRRLS